MIVSISMGDHSDRLLHQDSDILLNNAYILSQFRNIFLPGQLTSLMLIANISPFALLLPEIEQHGPDIPWFTLRQTRYISADDINFCIFWSIWVPASC